MTKATLYKGRESAAFTIVEVLVVVAIIGVLAALIFPVMSRARESAHRSKVVQYGRQLATGFTLYAAEYDDLLPLADSEHTLMGTPITGRGLEEVMVPSFAKSELFHPFPNAESTPEFENRWGRPMSSWVKFNERLSHRFIRLSSVDSPSRVMTLMNSEARREELINRGQPDAARVLRTTVWLDGSVKAVSWAEATASLD